MKTQLEISYVMYSINGNTCSTPCGSGLNRTPFLIHQSNIFCPDFFVFHPEFHTICRSMNTDDRRKISLTVHVSGKKGEYRQVLIGNNK